MIALAAIGAVLGVYFKGRSAGVDAVKADDAAASQKLNNDVRVSEAKNQQTEKDKNNEIQSIDSASDSKSVTSLLNSQSKSSDDSSSK